MGRVKGILAAGCASLLLAAGIGAQGIIPDRMTFVTIDAPVSLPGIVLPAGTYMFRLADTQASRNVVQIFDKERSKIFATLITVSAERGEPSGETVITFRETPAEKPPALRYWYYAGEKAGHEFVYPRDQAMRIAQASGESVLAVDTTSTDLESMKSGDISRVDATAAEESAQPTTRTPAEPPIEQPEPDLQAQPAEPPATPTEPAVTPAEPTATPTEPPDLPQRPEATEPAPQPAPTTGSPAVTPQPTGTSGRSTVASPDSAASRELPRTASELPAIGVAGVLALAAAIGARALRRRLTS